MSGTFIMQVENVLSAGLTERGRASMNTIQHRRMERRGTSQPSTEEWRKEELETNHFSQIRHVLVGNISM